MTFGACQRSAQLTMSHNCPKIVWLQNNSFDSVIRGLTVAAAALLACLSNLASFAWPCTIWAAIWSVTACQTLDVSTLMQQGQANLEICYRLSSHLDKVNVTPARLYLSCHDELVLCGHTQCACQAWAKSCYCAEQGASPALPSWPLFQSTAAREACASAGQSTWSTSCHKVRTMETCPQYASLTNISGVLAHACAQQLL